VKRNSNRNISIQPETSFSTLFLPELIVISFQSGVRRTSTHIIASGKTFQRRRNDVIKRNESQISSSSSDEQDPYRVSIASFTNAAISHSIDHHEIAFLSKSASLLAIVSINQLKKPLQPNTKASQMKENNNKQLGQESIQSSDNWQALNLNAAEAAEIMRKIFFRDFRLISLMIENNINGRRGESIIIWLRRLAARRRMKIHFELLSLSPMPPFNYSRACLDLLPHSETSS
jgi:flagellar basal body rod protein FlgC